MTASTNTSKGFLRGHSLVGAMKAQVIAIITITLFTAHAGAVESLGIVTLDSVSPAQQRVYNMITLRGSGFGQFVAGVSRVIFENDDVTIQAIMPYVWRDDFIKIRVPTGQRIAGVNQPIPKSPLLVSVIASNGTSNGLDFKVIAVTDALLSFIQKTQISGNMDVSDFLGNPNYNIARVKDADISDVNGDGFPDLIDNSSNNETNSTHAVVRTNLAGMGFDAALLEPLNANDNGDYLTTVLPGGDYVVDSVTYDADFVDLNNDGLPEIVHAATFDGGSRVRILVNNHEGVPGRFLEDTATWIPNHNFPGSPDDISHIDVNHDGFIDIAVGIRFTGQGEIFLNQNGTSFNPNSIILSAGGGSMHDTFFIDANHNGHPDSILVNESGNCRLLLHDGNANPGYVLDASFGFSGWSGIAADFNADGFDDFVLTGSSAVAIFLNNPNNPGVFSQTNLSGGVGVIYDVEAGDINLDGAVDLVSASIVNSGEESIDIWMNNGDGTFFNATSPGASALLPDIADYQRLSADLIDFDMDGDLDLYITGADGQNVGFGFGAVPNQFYENTLRCTADLDANGSITTSDLLILLSAWGPNKGHIADLDGDGSVGTSDLLILLANWGPCPL